LDGSIVSCGSGGVGFKPEQPVIFSAVSASASPRVTVALDWQAVLTSPGHCTYARALLDDLADALGEPAPFPSGGAVAPLTARKHRAPDAVLRNL
jgi:hypothetical protein